jgi:hypothetical protein
VQWRSRSRKKRARPPLARRTTKRRRVNAGRATWPATERLRRSRKAPSREMTEFCTPASESGGLGHLSLTTRRSRGRQGPTRPMRAFVASARVPLVFYTQPVGTSASLRWRSTTSTSRRCSSDLASSTSESKRSGSPALASGRTFTVVCTRTRSRQIFRQDKESWETGSSICSRTRSFHRGRHISLSKRFSSANSWS